MVSIQYEKKLPSYVMFNLKIDTLLCVIIYD